MRADVIVLCVRRTRRAFNTCEVCNNLRAVVSIRTLAKNVIILISLGIYPTDIRIQFVTTFFLCYLPERNFSPIQRQRM